jgi:hypothetical protein
MTKLSVRPVIKIKSAPAPKNQIETINGFDFIYSKSNRGFWVKGDRTYEFRKNLAAFDGEWNPYKKAWYYRMNQEKILLEFIESITAKS